ncbi:Clp protease ClpP [Collinsella sp. AGMB00827]|uniref:ATP-dependent Clp protease proteolytic subunit n=1 Tax=Collinsella ureilytica TaxID=2869515 RepID=A0ABS7MHG7_9ACTN|nr:head maturation protease, ClpP-related [Collinsella urealyticum]MBY4796789.1 Clp protease ClpP [Collinsella urealyticum]
MQDIDVYGFIASEKWSEGDVCARDFIAALRAADGDDVVIHINSGGGDTMEAAAMAEAIRSYSGRTTASIEGLAASAASYFALMADEVVMNPYALMMIHNPYTLCAGDASDMREAADLLDKVRGTISAQYVRKTGMDAAEIESMMDKETWMNAEEARELGFVDTLTDAEPIAACISADTLKTFSHIPAALCHNRTGEIETNIQKDAETEQAAPGAGGSEAEAASKVICVDGLFLNIRE